MPSTAPSKGLCLSFAVNGPHSPTSWAEYGDRMPLHACATGLVVAQADTFRPVRLLPLVSATADTASKRLRSAGGRTADATV